mmetsp:Transcript_51129/g.119783  ORF Transcript_51129/g.119783 Transcript_51129/m.119783 type:complete len:217 (-) Transcript_51129:158-808(-)
MAIRRVEHRKLYACVTSGSSCCCFHLLQLPEAQHALLIWCLQDEAEREVGEGTGLAKRLQEGGDLASTCLHEQGRECKAEDSIDVSKHITWSQVLHSLHCNKALVCNTEVCQAYAVTQLISKDLTCAVNEHARPTSTQIRSTTAAGRIGERRYPQVRGACVEDQFGSTPWGANVEVDGVDDIMHVLQILHIKVRMRKRPCRQSSGCTCSDKLWTQR